MLVHCDWLSISIFYATPVVKIEITVKDLQFTPATSTTPTSTRKTTLNNWAIDRIRSFPSTLQLKFLKNSMDRVGELRSDSNENLTMLKNNRRIKECALYYESFRETLNSPSRN